ncbi:MAG: hypothetical protein M3Y46_07485 [Actinomycetota bacterium]|jgi:hypothetical protein|nr:hypothetical protein [Actinomycetota bacterium]HET8895941.1 hypothetical protein [Protaetiibacter sp.]
MTESKSSTNDNGRPIAADDVVEAVTRAPLRYQDGSTQVFTPDGNTTFVEHGRRTTGEWGVDHEGSFWSFWPPDYRASYKVYWITDAERSDAVAGTASGVRFVERRGGAVSDGRYQGRVTRG